MTMARLFRILLLATMLLSLSAFGIAERNVPVFIVVVGLTVAGWWLNEGSNRARAGESGWKGIPRWISAFLLLIIVLAAATRGWIESDPISAFEWLLAFTLLLKLWERRQIKDYGQILTISVFLSIGATLSDASLSLGLVLLLQLPVLAATVLVYQVCMSAAKAGANVHAPGAAWSRLRNSTVRVIALDVAVSIFGAISIAGAAFVLIPRGIGLHQFASFQPQFAGRTTGFTDVVDLDQGGLISQSPLPVMDVRITDGRGRPLAQFDRPIYLRGAVLDQYRNRAWVHEEEAPSTTQLMPGMDSGDLWPSGPFRMEPNPSEVMVQRVTLRSVPKGQTPLFSLFAPRHVVVFRRADIRHDPATGWLLASTPDSSSFTYEVRSTPLPDNPDFERDRRGIATFESPLITQVASRLLKSAGIDPAWYHRPPDEDAHAARIFETYLRAEFQYTLDVPAPPLKRDPIEWFLTESRKGHCEYFASALAALCRSVGIDARVIAGYMATECDPYTGEYVVRANNAHAWVEVNTGLGRWDTFDATPQASLAALRDSQRGAFGFVGQFLAEMRDAWNARVVTFDQWSQERLLAENPATRSWVGKMSAWVRGVSDDEPYRRRRPPDPRFNPTYLAIGISSLALVSVATFLSRRRRLPDARGWAVTKSARPLYDAVVSILLSRGVPNPSAVPLWRHVRQSRVGSTGLSSALADAAEAIYAHQFGGESLSPQRSRELIRRLRIEARAR